MHSTLSGGEAWTSIVLLVRTPPDAVLVAAEEGHEANSEVSHRAPCQNASTDLAPQSTS